MDRVDLTELRPPAQPARHGTLRKLLRVRGPFLLEVELAVVQHVAIGETSQPVRRRPVSTRPLTTSAVALSTMPSCGSGAAGTGATAPVPSMLRTPCTTAACNA